MLTSADLDDFARRYYLADDVGDHRLENRMQIDSAPRILQLLPVGAKVLELGFGDGLLTQALHDAGVAAELVEGSPLLCTHARSSYPTLTVHNTLFEAFEPPQLYDAVLVLHVLEHVDDPQALLRRISTWMKPDGLMVLLVPNRASIHRRVALEMGLIARLDELSQRDHLVGHKRVYDLETLEHDARAAGFVTKTRFGSFLKVLPNSMMLNHSDEILRAIDAVSAALPPDLLANIGVVIQRATPASNTAAG